MCAQAAHGMRLFYGRGDYDSLAVSIWSEFRSHLAASGKTEQDLALVTGQPLLYCWRFESPQQAFESSSSPLSSLRYRTPVPTPLSSETVSKVEEAATHAEILC